MVAPFLTSSTTAVLIFAVLPRAGGVELNFLTWAFYAAPANAILLVGMIAAVWLAYRPRTHAEAATRLFTHTQARPAALAYAVIVVVALCASVIPWRMMGLL
jgi:di/tricarboxylate transporter